MMGILSALFGRTNRESNALVGCWHLVAGERWGIMKLRYRIDGDTLVTNQPSAPREERSRFALAPDGTLTIEFGGNKGAFRRGEKKAPSV